jgi:hypothetical protein
MLILRRKEGQWVEITHRSGDTIRLRVCNIRSRASGQLDIAFEDVERNFAIERLERAATRPAGGRGGDGPSLGRLALRARRTEHKMG